MGWQGKPHEPAGPPAVPAWREHPGLGVATRQVGPASLTEDERGDLERFRAALESIAKGACYECDGFIQARVALGIADQ